MEAMEPVNGEQRAADVAAQSLQLFPLVLSDREDFPFKRGATSIRGGVLRGERRSWCLMHPGWRS